MPLPPPILDPRKYQDLLDETLARIPVHTPEWTNFNASDPGVTLAALFAFLTENSLHLLNRAPESLARRFLERLQLPMQAGAAAQGLVTIVNDRGQLETVTLDADIEVRAGAVPFRTQRGLDVLPLEARAFVKRKVPQPDPRLLAYYSSLYTSFLAESSGVPELYETVLLTPSTGAGIDIGAKTVDSVLWIALLLPAAVKPPDQDRRKEARASIAGKTLSLALMPVIDVDEGKVLPAGSVAGGAEIVAPEAQLTVQIPRVLAGGLPGNREPAYRTLMQALVPTSPTVLEVPLPAAADLELWEDLDPLEPGAGNFPPPMEDTALEPRIVTWLRVAWPEGAKARVLWAGINTVLASQRTRVVAEILPDGNGRPDQTVALAQRPVLHDTVTLLVTTGENKTASWSEVEDLALAGPEVAAPDPRHPPGSLWEAPTRSDVFALDAEAGVLRFGDGLRGRRPPAGARLVVAYDYSSGADGNLRGGAVNQAPALPPGLTVTNLLPTWGGAHAESPEEGQKHVARWLQHRDRLVTDEDFRTIPRRAPGLDVGRIEVLALYDPRLGEQTEPGAAPGVVTLLVVPGSDRIHPDTPEPDARFLQALCQYLEPRRLLTTELVLRGPKYVPIWVSVGVGVAATQSAAVVRERVEQALHEFLSPLPRTDTGVPELSPLLTAPDLNAIPGEGGWPWRKAVSRSELLAAVARVRGVVSVLGVTLAKDSGPDTDSIPMGPLNFPRLAGLSVVVGPPLDLDQLRGPTTTTPADGQPKRVAVPFVPREC